MQHPRVIRIVAQAGGSIRRIGHGKILDVRQQIQPPIWTVAGTTESSYLLAAQDFMPCCVDTVDVWFHCTWEIVVPKGHDAVFSHGMYERHVHCSPLIYPLSNDSISMDRVS